MDEREATWRSEGWTGYTGGTASTRGTSTAARGTKEGEEAIPIVEENLRVGKRQVEGGRVKIRSYVVETPVQEQVNLRQEHVRKSGLRRAIGPAPCQAFCRHEWLFAGLLDPSDRLPSGFRVNAASRPSGVMGSICSIWPRNRYRPSELCIRWRDQSPCACHSDEAQGSWSKPCHSAVHGDVFMNEKVLERPCCLIVEIRP